MNRVFVSMQDDISKTVEKKAQMLLENSPIEEFVLLVLEKIGRDKEEISVFFCDDDFIRAYNAKDREIDAPTDILEYENGSEYEDEQGKWRLSGDMLINLEMLPKNADSFGVSEDEELKRLLTHGVLHLCGMNHGEEHLEVGIEPKCEMLVLQEKILLALSDTKLL